MSHGEGVPRVLLILCYLFSVLMGPQPCCCAAPSPTPAQPITVKTAPAKGCPHCVAASKPDQAPKPDQPLPVKKPNCPCPKAAVSAPAVPPAEDDGRSHIVAHGTITGFTPVVEFSGHSSQITIVGPPPDPSAHLIQLCHRLRC